MRDAAGRKTEGKRRRKYEFLRERMERYGRFLDLFDDWILAPINFVKWIARVSSRLLD